MERIPQDYLGGDLTTKSISELKDLLQRQEKLLQKIKFLNNLPDGGQKVRDFTEKLKVLINDKQESVSKPEIPKQPVISHASLESKTQTKVDRLTDITEKQHTSKPVSRFKKEKGSINKSANKECKENVEEYKNFNLLVTEETKMADITSTDEIVMNSHDHVTRHKISLDDLSDTLENMDISSDTAGHVSCGAEEYLLNFIERTHQNKKREPMKLNRELKISNITDLPSELRCPADKRTNAPQKKITTMWDESAVCPPKYKYKTVKEMPLQESMRLQDQQSKRREESQAIYAAEKLAEKLNIRMETFNTEGKDIIYREPVMMDSDDDLEGVD